MDLVLSWEVIFCCQDDSLVRMGELSISDQSPPFKVIEASLHFILHQQFPQKPMQILAKTPGQKQSTNATKYSINYIIYWFEHVRKPVLGWDITNICQTDT